MATHSSILAWRIPTDRGAWQAMVHEVAESDTTEQLNTKQDYTDQTTLEPISRLLSRADCAVSACSPLSSPIKALAH